MDKDFKKEWRDIITKLVISIGEQLKMEKNDQILMLMFLNTPRKIKKFSDWARSKTENNKINSTPEEVMHIVSVIQREAEAERNNLPAE